MRTHSFILADLSGVTGAAFIVGGVIVSRHVHHGIGGDVQVAALKEKRIIFSIRFSLRNLGIAADVNRPTPIVVAKG